MDKELDNIINQFCFSGEVTAIKPITQGLINATYKVECSGGSYILQQINNAIFKNPQRLMENIDKVTAHLKAKIKAAGGNPEREALNIVKTKGGKLLLEENGFWRAYLFIENAQAYEKASPELFCKCAVAFGKFQRMLDDFDASRLFEVIEGFHDTSARYKAFLAAVENDACNRAAEVSAEIQFIKDRACICTAGAELLKAGKIKLRVTHNDTKLNNIMMDNDTGEGLCVLDLDTVMPGLLMYDFGDSIRFGANTALEDEPDISKVSLDMSLFEAYAKGYLSVLKGVITEGEKQSLVLGARVITLEQMMRFLGDYINGDTYYKAQYKEHNLVRARNQQTLLLDIEKKSSIMQEIIETNS